MLRFWGRRREGKRRAGEGRSEEMNAKRRKGMERIDVYFFHYM